MRIWLQKQKKKEEAKAAAQATPAPVETTPPVAETQSTGDAADQPMESIEDTTKAEVVGGEEAAGDKANEASHPTGSAAPQTIEVGLRHSALFLYPSTHELQCSGPDLGSAFGPLAKMNMIVAACASDHKAIITSPCTVADPCQDSVAPQTAESERRGSNASQNVTKSVEPPTTGAPTDEQSNANGPNGGMMGNNPMMMNGMGGQMPYGFPNQPGFNNGMYGMNGMPNMMANGSWNGMNSMGRSPQASIEGLH
jgi:hypothetical protein